MKSNVFVILCGYCWLCKYTRKCTKQTVFYRIARFVQKICPFCYMANKKLGKDFQKGNV